MLNKNQQKIIVEEMIRKRIVELNMESTESLDELAKLNSNIEFGPDERECYEFYKAEKNDIERLVRFFITEIFNNSKNHKKTTNKVAKVSVLTGYSDKDNESMKTNQ